MQDLTVSGILSLDGEGKIVTDSDTGAQRILITSTAADRIQLMTGSTLEDKAGLIMGSESAGILVLSAVGPTTSLLGFSPCTIKLGTNELSLSGGDTTGGVRVYGPVDMSTGTLTAGTVVVETAVNGPAASTYDPNLGVLSGTTLPSVGTGSNAAQQGVYSRIGPQVTANITIKWSSNGAAGNGTYRISPPKGIHSGIPVGASVGGGRVNDASANDSWLVDCRKAGTTSINLRYNTTGTPNVTNSVPFTFGSSNDEIQLHLTYLTTET